MAASKLPHEILCQIATYCASRAPYMNQLLVRLGPYALVNRAWQAAFEEQIYNTIHLQSPSEISTVVVGRKEPISKRGLTFDQLGQLLANRRRAALIKHIFYWVAVPHWLPDGWFERLPEVHTYDNRFRPENDAAFTMGVRAWFEFLGSKTWEKPFVLTVLLQAENLYDADMRVEPGVFPWELCERPLAHYRASFLPGTVLQSVECVRKVEFPAVYTPRTAMAQQNQLSLPAQMQIVAACGGCEAFVDVKLDGLAYVPLGDRALLAAKRNDFAASLALLPPQIRTISMEWDDVVSPMKFEGMATIPQSPPIPADPLSRARNVASRQLRELRLEAFDATPELFSVFEKETQVPIFWPHLEVLRLTLMPIALPNGAPLLYDYEPVEGEPSVPITPSGKKRLHDQQNQDTALSVLPEYFDEMYASAGRAAQKMPRLRDLLLSFGHVEQGHYLELRSTGSQKRQLEMYSFYGYSPCEEVLQAWRIPEGGMVHRHDLLQCDFESWPPS